MDKVNNEIPVSIQSSTPKIYRSEKHRAIGGVCAGIAMTHGYSIALVRMVALGIAWISGAGVLIYLLAWIVVPKASRRGVSEPVETPHDPVKRSSTDKKLGGVCAGLARYLDVDVTTLRLVYLIFILLGGIGVVPYLYAWMIIPLDNSPQVA